MYNRTGYSRGVVGFGNDFTTSPLFGVDLADPQVGETYFDLGRTYTYDGQVWMCSDYIKTVNRTGATIGTGTIMLYGATASPGDLDTYLIVSNANYSTNFAGVVVYESIANGPLVVQYKGYCSSVTVSGYGGGVTGGSTGCGYYLSPSSAGGAIVHDDVRTGIFGFLNYIPGFILKTALIRPRVERY